MDEAYEIGYGKPPRDSQFTKGLSGNPKGRPKGSKNMMTMFNQIARELIDVKSNGRAKTMTHIEAILRQLMNRALSGDPRAAREVLQLSRVFEEMERIAEDGGVLAVPHERETAVLKSVLMRMRRMADDAEPTIDADKQTGGKK